MRIPPVRVAEKEMPSERRAAVPARAFEVVYEDDALLVVNKPSGVAVHGGSGVSFGVIEQLRRARPEAKYLELVHRLDKDTSGLLMVAKKRSALVKLHEAIRNDHPKNLPCAGGGQTAGRQFPCQTAPVQIYRRTRRKDGTRQRGRAVGAYGVPCVKPFLRRHFARCRAVAPDFGAGNAENGRTHQIRVHLQSQGCPIAGDERYGDYQANRRLQKLGLKRMFCTRPSCT